MNAAQTTRPPGVDVRGIATALHRAHPDTPFAVIEAEVAEAARTYGDATIADFLPVLIERRVRNRLRAGEAAAWPLK